MTYHTTLTEMWNVKEHFGEVLSLVLDVLI